MASGSRSITGGSDETFLHVCDVCKYNNKTSEAISFCTECTEYLCDVCDQTHQGLKATRHHKIVTGSNMPSSPVSPKSLSPAMYCEHHKTMTLNVYCVSHSDVICGTCKLTDHRKCETTGLKDQRKNINIQEAIGDTMRRMLGLQNKFENLRESILGEKVKLKIQIEKYLDDMKEMRQKINDKIDFLEKTLEKQASDIQADIDREIENHVTIADDALNQIKDRIKSLEHCQELQDGDVIFVGMKKAYLLKNKYETALSTLKKVIFSIEMKFKPNDVVLDLLLQLQTLGTFQIKKNRVPGVNVLNITVDERREIDVGCRDVPGCTFIGDNHLVAACGNDGLKLLDKHFKVQSQLPVSSDRVATINENDVIVTQSNTKQLQRVSIFPNMTVTETLKMDRRCWGVDVFNNEIYVTCDDGPGNGEVRVLNMDGILQRQLGVNDGQYMFSGPGFIKVSRDGSKVFISDWDTNKVTCLSQQGDILYQYTDRKLKCPAGMYVDDEGTVLVCGYNSHNVHMINRDGSKQKIMLSKKDGMKYPLCISYRPRDGCLVVGLWKADKSLLVYQTQE